MKTTAIATLLALGMLPLVAPVASADPLDNVSTGDVIQWHSPICYYVGIVPFSTTVYVGSVAVTVSSGIAQDIARGCIL